MLVLSPTQQISTSKHFYLYKNHQKTNKHQLSINIRIRHAYSYIYI